MSVETAISNEAVTADAEVENLEPLEDSKQLPDNKNSQLETSGSNANFRNLRFAEVLRSRISSELGIKCDNLSPACIMDIAQLEEVQKFIDVEDSVTDLLTKYQSKLTNLVEKVQVETEKCSHQSKKINDPTKNEEEVKENVTEEGKVVVDESSKALKIYLISFAQEAAEFYTDMGAIYLNLYKDMAATATPNTPNDSSSTWKKSATTAKDNPKKSTAPATTKSAAKSTKEKPKQEVKPIKGGAPVKKEEKKVKPDETPLPKPDIQPVEIDKKVEVDPPKKEAAKKAPDPKKKIADKKMDAKKTSVVKKK